MTKQHVENLYRAFKTQGHTGMCDTCGNVRTCISHVADLTNECFNCCIERLVREEEEQEREKHRVPLNLESFCK